MYLHDGTHLFIIVTPKRFFDTAFHSLQTRDTFIRKLIVFLLV